MPTVADALDPKFTRSWHEAVAIVQEVASQLSSGLNVPDVQNLFFDDEGAITFAFASEVTTNPLLDLAVLLKGLLEGTGAPQGLLDLAEENATASPAHPTIESFSRALAFYERPGRANDLRAVAARLSTHEPVTNPEEIVEKLRAKIAGHHSEAEGVKRPAAKRRGLIAAAVGMAALLLGASVWAWFGRAQSVAPNSQEIVDGVEQKIANVVSAGLNRLGGVKTGSSLAKADSPVKVDERRPKVAASSERSTVKRPSTSAAPSASAAVVGGASAALDLPAIAPIPYAIDSPGYALDEPITTDGTPRTLDGVYSAADRNVQPPVFLRPQLANQPAATAQTGYFDMVVSETGEVQIVKLFSPAHSFHDRMLVAAAKAWRFRPAMRDGKPVSYRMRVSIILPGNS
jgi:hypothetical protein